jgi:hypothetical protein
MKRAEYTSDKREELHTLLIFFRRVGSFSRTTFMHTGSP